MTNHVSLPQWMHTFPLFARVLLPNTVRVFPQLPLSNCGAYRAASYHARGCCPTLTDHRKRENNNNENDKNKTKQQPEPLLVHVFDPVPLSSFGVCVGLLSPRSQGLHAIVIE